MHAFSSMHIFMKIGYDIIKLATFISHPTRKENILPHPSSLESIFTLLYSKVELCIMFITIIAILDT